MDNNTCAVKEETYEHVNHPNHYNIYDVEVVEMMKRIWGPEETAIWAKLNAFKYRMRAGTKPGNSIERDMKKEQWCLMKQRELQAEISLRDEINKKQNF